MILANDSWQSSKKLINGIEPFLCFLRLAFSVCCETLWTIRRDLPGDWSAAFESQSPNDARVNLLLYGI